VENIELTTGNLVKVKPTSLLDIVLDSIGGSILAIVVDTNKETQTANVWMEDDFMYGYSRVKNFPFSHLTRLDCNPKKQ